MIIEICDLCEKRLTEDNYTEVWVRKPVWLADGDGMPFLDNRKKHAKICNECVNKLKVK